MTPSSAPAERLFALDLVRGVAMMGILLLNIVGFGLPEAAYFNPRAYGGAQGLDLAAWAINFVLFDGKMRGLFSFLFGASTLLIADRAEANRQSAASVHLRRMLWLLLFGLAHLWLVWSGDILAQYALIGLVAFLFRDLQPRPLVVLGVLLLLLVFALHLQVPLQVQQALCCAADRHALDALNLTFGTPPASEIARELALYQSGYAKIVQQRFADYPLGPLPSLVFFGPETLAYMLFGMAALRSGLLAGAWPRARYRRWWLRSWAVALPASIALALYQMYARFSLFAVTLGAFALTVPVRPLMIIGWACLLLLIFGRPGALTKRIAAAGRMAFTHYLCTSLICTSLFYGYGLGWFGQLSRWQLYGVVAALWAGMLLISQSWLSRFRFGPFEWIWRSLARGQLQPMRLRKSATASQ
jgi:uncharacterized protein